MLTSMSGDASIWNRTTWSTGVKVTFEQELLLESAAAVPVVANTGTSKFTDYRKTCDVLVRNKDSHEPRQITFSSLRPTRISF